MLGSSSSRNKNKQRTFAIIGLGNFGSTVAKDLTQYGNYVIGLDTSEKRVSDHAEILTQAMIVDAKDDLALREAGVAEAALKLD